MDAHPNNPILEELQKQTQLLQRQASFFIKILEGISIGGSSGNEYLTIKDAARLFKRSPETIRRWIRKNKIQGMKFNEGKKQDRYFIPKDAIDNLRNEFIKPRKRGR